MDISELRALVQKTLKDERGVTDVAFTPLDAANERVSFYEHGHRCHFAICVDEYLDNADLLESHVNYWAGMGLDAAKDKAALTRAKAAEKAQKEATGVRVVSQAVLP